MPVAWEELDDVDPTAFTLETAAAQAAKGKNPWNDYDKTRQRLTHAMRRKLG